MNQKALLPVGRDYYVYIHVFSRYSRYTAVVPAQLINILINIVPGIA